MYPNRYQYHDSFLQRKKKVVVLDKNEDTLLRGTSLDLLGRLCELAGEHQQEWIKNAGPLWIDIADIADIASKVYEQFVSVW